MIALIGGVSLVLEGGNAYAHQRSPRTRPTPSPTPGPRSSPSGSAAARRATPRSSPRSTRWPLPTASTRTSAYYTECDGEHAHARWAVTTTSTSRPRRSAPADGGDITIPPGAQGVAVGGSQTFGTTFARAIGINQFTASAEATAVAGALDRRRLHAGRLPRQLADCDGSGNTVVSTSRGGLSNPDPPTRPLIRSARSTSCPCARRAAARS